MLATDVYVCCVVVYVWCVCIYEHFTESPQISQEEKYLPYEFFPSIGLLIKNLFWVPKKALALCELETFHNRYLILGGMIFFRGVWKATLYTCCAHLHVRICVCASALGSFLPFAFLQKKRIKPASGLNAFSHKVFLSSSYLGLLCYKG